MNVVEEEKKEEEAEAMDIDDMDDSGNVFGTDKYVVMNQEEDTVQKNRTYDLSITYDFYY